MTAATAALTPTNISVRGASELDQYISEISKYRLLSREEEVDLARQYRDKGDVGAAHQLVVSNLRFVVKVAHGYRGYGLKLIDLVQEGNMGLMHAVKKFDPEKGYRLISYAVWWIKAQIQSYIMRTWSMVKLGSGRVRRKLFFKLRSEKSRLELEAGPDGDASNAALADRLGVEEAEIDEMEARMSFRDYSLDAPLNETGDMTHVDVLSDETPLQDTVVEERESHALAHRLVDDIRADLNDKEKVILERRLLSDEPDTLAAIGKDLGISRERVRQLEARMLSKLRGAAQERSLIPA